MIFASQVVPDLGDPTTSITESAKRGHAES